MNGGTYLVGLSICIGYLQDCKKTLSGPIYKRFENDGVDICLRDYPDPSFLKMTCSRSELMKPEICKERTMLMKPRYINLGLFHIEIEATQYRTQAILGPCGQL